MTRGTDLRAHVRERIQGALAAEGWSGGGAEEPIVLELPRDFAHGDLACPAAFALAKRLKRRPAEIAATLVGRLTPDDIIERAEVAGGGYVNLFFGEGVWLALLAEIEAHGAQFGTGRTLSEEHFLVEFISANPTGPLVVANARAAVFGNSLCRCLEAAGASVEREYLVNDAGAQVRNLALSVEARWREAVGRPFEIPKDGYHGEYVRDLAAKARVHFGDAFLPSPDLQLEPSKIEELVEFSVRAMVDRQGDDLNRLGVRFDRFFSEHELHAAGKVAETLKDLIAAGVTVEREGAVWFLATRFGDEKDRVLMKADRQPTYTLPDVAYHRDKFRRNYTCVVNIVGADHIVEQGTLRQALTALGEPVDRLEVIIVQFVNLKRGTEKVVMSKRAGAVVSLAELLDEVSPDAARFFFLLRAPSSHLDFDLELAKARTMDNPVYYVQYAHARLCSLLERAREAGLPPPSAAAAARAGLAEDDARLLLRQLARYPLVVEQAARGRAPHLLAHELQELANAVHQFYTRNRVVGAGSPELEATRLALVAAARQVLANGLAVLGVTAPARMERKESS